MILTLVCIRFFGSYYGFRTFATSTYESSFTNKQVGKIRPRRTVESTVYTQLSLMSIPPGRNVVLIRLVKN
jgi:hypothetical protein